MANCTPISAINVAVHPDLQLNRVCTPRSAAARLFKGCTRQSPQLGGKVSEVKHGQEALNSVLQ